VTASEAASGRSSISEGTSFSFGFGSPPSRTVVAWLVPESLGSSIGEPGFEDEIDLSSSGNDQAVFSAVEPEEDPMEAGGGGGGGGGGACGSDAGAK
jgi:hypothetical protein